MNKTTVFAIFASATLFFSPDAHAHGGGGERGGGGGGHYHGGGGGGYGHGGHGWDGHDHGWDGHNHHWDGHNHHWNNDWHSTNVGIGFGGGYGWGPGYDGSSPYLTADAYQEQNVIVNNPYPPSDSYDQDSADAPEPSYPQNSQDQPPSFTAQLAGPSTVKVGELVTINLPYTAGMAPFTVLWRTDNNQPWSKGNLTFQVRAMQQGPMNIQVVIRDNSGAFSAPQNVQVQVQ